MTTLNYIGMFSGFIMWFITGYVIGRRNGRKDQVDIINKVFNLPTKTIKNPKRYPVVKQ